MVQEGLSQGFEGSEKEEKVLGLKIYSPQSLRKVKGFSLNESRNSRFCLILYFGYTGITGIASECVSCE